MSISTWRLLLLALIALALVVSALLGTAASAQDDGRSVSAHAAPR